MLGEVDKLTEILLGFVITIGHYKLMEAAFSRTIGKTLTGTKVMDERGKKPSLGKILGRTFCRIIPFEAFSFLAADGRGWHDSIPGTYVVKSR